MEVYFKSGNLLDFCAARLTVIIMLLFVQTRHVYDNMFLSGCFVNPSFMKVSLDCANRRLPCFSIALTIHIYNRRKKFESEPLIFLHFVERHDDYEYFMNILYCIQKTMSSIQGHRFMALKLKSFNICLHYTTTSLIPMSFVGRQDFSVKTFSFIIRVNGAASKRQ